MKKVYFAGRISSNPEDDDVLKIGDCASTDDIFNIYTRKKIYKDKFIKNGHWILRSPLDKKKLPEELTPEMIWQMVKFKIEDSDIFVGIINTQSFGTIAEAGYASSLGKPVYILLDESLNNNDKDDLWFVMQFSKNTKDFWSEEDINNIESFSKRGIFNISDYREYIESIIPIFLK